METIDVLGPRPERRELFTRELLAEADDAELQQIVEKAARDLGTPIALVTLVLDQIQFFKAHYGLPPALAASRGTRRDVSFCQFVVRDGEPFEVVDAPNDPRVPQHLVEAYGIRAYLGIPVRVRDAVVGSLCVIDTRARHFSEEERESLTKLAALVDARVSALTERRRQVRTALAEQASLPALAELRESLGPIREGLEASLPALSAIRSFLRLAAHVFDGGAAPPGAAKRHLAAAVEAATAGEDGLHDIEAAAADCEDCLLALERLLTPSLSPRLSEVLVAAQDLARQATRPVGDAPLPDLAFDPLLYAPRPLAVALLAVCLSGLAARLASQGAEGGIRMRVVDRGDTAELAISAPDLADAAVEEVAAELRDQIGGDPSLLIHSGEGELRLAFAVRAPEGEAPAPPRD